MQALDIETNRKTSKYTRKELVLRVLWGVGKIFFRLTPRPCFGVRRSILRLFGAKVGRNVHIYPSSLIYYPWNLEIHDDSAVGEWALIYNLGKIKIGTGVTLSQRVHLCAGTHDYKNATLPLVKSTIVICSSAWVCADAFVGPGVCVGEGAIVGAAAAVFKDVPPMTIVGGNPAKFIKHRVPPGMENNDFDPKNS